MPPPPSASAPWGGGGTAATPTLTSGLHTPVKLALLTVPRLAASATTAPSARLWHRTAALRHARAAALGVVPGRGGHTDGGAATTGDEWLRVLRGHFSLELPCAAAFDEFRASLPQRLDAACAAAEAACVAVPDGDGAAPRRSRPAGWDWSC